MKMRFPAIHGRREALYFALAAAEVCWIAPTFLALTRAAGSHPPLLLWLGMLVLLLGYFYFYRALVEVNLSLRLQQGLLVAGLLLSIGLLLRFHVYASLGGIEWLLQPFSLLLDVAASRPAGWIAVMTLLFLWVRSLHLARRSISVASVGFSFRAGVVILVVTAMVIGFFTGGDVSGFVAPYFFFGLSAVALARIEEVSLVPNSSRTGYSSFWVGSTVGAVGLLVLVGMVAAAFLSGGGLRQVLVWLDPAFQVLSYVVAALGLLIVMLFQGLVSLLNLDLGALGQGLQEALQRLGEFLIFPQASPPPGSNPATRPAILGVLQVVMTIAIPTIIILLVVLFTWQRMRKRRRDERDEAHESLLSARAVADNLRAMLRSGLDRLGELAGLVDRFGLGARFLSAISIRRIYANLVRLATQAGYPRSGAQTPYEYLETLRQAFPGSEADVALITEAYVGAHYGQVPDSRQELQRIRDCWERLRVQVKT